MSKILFTSALAVLVSASLLAQATQSSAPSPSTAAAQAASAITVQGCVEPSVIAVSATPDAVGTTGRSVSTATAFILTSAMKPTGTSGSSTTSASPVEPTYQLSVEDSRMVPHVGHLIEVSGPIVAPDKTKEASAASAKGAPPAPTLKVESIKMIAETCEAGK